ncbi:unnamed protein product [Vicia faba]|uniref:Uncharacterized protein n=1 Tax=Vicia faba TaxID=3906 RepID=A0AAV1A6S3_VICFA|nr:unnamed protein product [Vicia faba]
MYEVFVEGEYSSVEEIKENQDYGIEKIKFVSNNKDDIPQNEDNVSELMRMCLKKVLGILKKEMNGRKTTTKWLLKSKEVEAPNVERSQNDMEKDVIDIFEGLVEYKEYVSYEDQNLKILDVNENFIGNVEDVVPVVVEAETSKRNWKRPKGRLRRKSIL